MSEESPFDREAVPEQNPDVDIESLDDPPSSDDFFLYSRIDGGTSVESLCTTSGLGREKTVEVLKRLCDRGLVEIPGYQPADASAGATSAAGEPSEAEGGASGGGPSSAAEEESSASGDDGGETGIDLSHLPTPPAEFDYDPELLALDVALDDEMKRELMVLSDQLDGLDHYQFFGVDREAGQKEIKMSYFQLSKRYHPDKHYGDELGPFEEMLEEIFQTITRAYRTLSNPDKREEYDAELAEREEDDEEEATPMNQASSVRMANKEASERQRNEDAEDAAGVSKRDAAFAQLVKVAKKRRKNGDFLDAAEAYRKALALRRELDVALQAAKVLLRADKRHDQAELFARAAVRIDDSSPEAYMLLGQALEKQDDEEEAREAYESVLELNPDHERAKTRRERLAAS